MWVYLGYKPPREFEWEYYISQGDSVASRLTNGEHSNQSHRLVCPACGEVIRAELPAGVPGSGFGPRGQAHQMLHDWHLVRNGMLADASFAHYMRPIPQEVERLINAG
jgi:hypothetical protein